MRRYLLIIFALIAASCSRQIPEIMESLYVTDGSAASKVCLSGTSAVWESGDKVSVFYGSNENECWTYTGADKSASGTLSHVHKGSRSSSVRKYAVYPYSEKTSFSEDVISAEIPSSQPYKAGSYGCSLMAAASDDSSLAFKYATGFIAIDICGTGMVKSLKLTPNSGEAIAGAAEIRFNEGVPVVKMSESASSTAITMISDDDVMFKLSRSNAVTAWFCLPPVELKDGFTLSMTYSSGTVKTYSFSGQEIITRGRVSRHELYVMEQSEMMKVLLDFRNGATPFTEAVPSDAGRFDEKTDPAFADGKEFTMKDGGYVLNIYTMYGLSNSGHPSYGFYFSTSKGYIIFGRQGSFIKLPKIPGKCLASVTYCAGSTSGYPYISTDRAGENRVSNKIVTTVGGEEYTMDLTNPSEDEDYYFYVSSGNICFYWVELRYFDI